MTLGAQVRHLVTCRDPPESTLIYTVFTKKCQKRCKKGYPLFLTGKLTVSPTRGMCRPGEPSRADLCPHFGHQMGQKIDFWACTRV